MTLQKPKGTQDILPKASSQWQALERRAREIFARYNYREIRTPMFEHYEVVSRSAGDTSDIVTKEMYDFYDKGDRHITLRPEGTAPVVRAFVENKLHAPEVQKPVKLYYMGPMFRYERPQAGRLRQFHQMGVETFGSANPATDAETMAMAVNFFHDLGIGDICLHLNTLGNVASRSAYRKALVDYLFPHQEALSEDSKRRLVDNPLRILDSKDKADQAIVSQAPSILDYLDQESLSHFEAVKEMLDALGIHYVIDPTMVRGLDYYTHTIFECMTTVAGEDLTICAGGRYDGLVTYFDGPETPGFGFGLGMERLLLVLAEQGIMLETDEGLDVYIVVIGSSVNQEALVLTEALRQQGLRVDRDMLNRKIKAQFKSADTLGARYIITIGQDEVDSDRVTIKHNETRQEVTASLTAVKDHFLQLLTDNAL